METTTSNPSGGIFKAELDGSNLVKIISGIKSPRGITIDFGSLRLFWADYSDNKIYSSNLDGTDVRLVVQLSSGAGPWGIEVTDEKLVWGMKDRWAIQSSDKTGQGIKNLYNGTNPIYHLTIATPNPV